MIILKYILNAYFVSVYELTDKTDLVDLTTLPSNAPCPYFYRVLTLQV